MIQESFREKLPFLEEIPDAIYSRLDLSEWILPDGEIDERRRTLEILLNTYIMTYNSGVFNTNASLEAHLCANLKGADLSPEQLKILQDEETKVRTKGVSFVAYQKPLQLIDPQNSPPAILYK